MSTIEDFENAPIGATATHSLASRAMKTDSDERGWVTPSGNYVSDEGMVNWGFTLEPPAPTTAREALDLAWELAHEVKEGQIIHAGTRFLEFHDSGIKEYTAYGDREISPGLAPITRTLDPLPVPLPDWLDAPAVIAVCNDIMARAVFVRRGNDQWRSEFYEVGTADLRDVVPLYPKGQDQ